MQSPLLAPAAKTFRLKFLLSFFCCFLFGCASALKEHCEKTNWFEHSRDVALEGRYLEEDLLIKSCKDIDTTNATQLDLGFKSGRERYCTYEGFLRRGEAGDIVNFKMCDELILRQMQERYGHGLNRFCTAEIGYSYGASGKMYKRVCFKEQEEAFLPKYYQGRKEFLQKSIAQTQVDISALTALQSHIEPQIHLITSEISTLPSPQECSSIQVYNQLSKKNESQTVCRESFYIQSRRTTLYSQVDQLRQQFTNHSGIISKSLAELQDFRTELTKIPLPEVSAMK